MFISNIFKYFPQNIGTLLEDYFKKNDTNMYIALEEIRLRVNKPIILKFNQTDKVFDYLVTTEDILVSLRILFTHIKIKFAMAILPLREDTG